MKPLKEEYYYNNFIRLFSDLIVNPFDEESYEDGIYIIDNYQDIWEDLINLDEKYEIWTVVEGENNTWFVNKGFRLINRIGYLITLR